MDIIDLDIAFVSTPTGDIDIHFGTEATYLNALAGVRAEYADLHRHAAHRADAEKLAALGVFNTYLAAAQAAAANLGRDFHMGHIIGK